MQWAVQAGWQLVLAHPWELFAGWALYCFAVWFFLLRQRKDTAQKKKAIAPARAGFKSLWQEAVSVHALVELLARAPHLGDRYQASVQLRQRLQRDAANEHQKRQSNLWLNEFLRTHGERVVSWIKSGEIALPPEEEAHTHKQVLELVDALSEHRVVRFFESKFNDAMEIQRAAQAPHPEPEDCRLKDRWVLNAEPSEEVPSRVYPPFRTAIPESEFVRMDVRVPNAVEVAGEQMGVDEWKALSPVPCALLRWGGDPVSPTVLWGLDWTKQQVVYNVSNHELLIPGATTPVGTQGEELARLLIREHFGWEDPATFAGQHPLAVVWVELAALLLAVPASWGVVVRCDPHSGLRKAVHDASQGGEVPEHTAQSLAQRAQGLASALLRAKRATSRFDVGQR